MGHLTLRPVKEETLPICYWIPVISGEMRLKIVLHAPSLEPWYFMFSSSPLAYFTISCFHKPLLYFTLTIHRQFNTTATYYDTVPSMNKSMGPPLWFGWHSRQGHTWNTIHTTQVRSSDALSRWRGKVNNTKISSLYLTYHLCSPSYCVNDQTNERVSNL